MYTPVNPSFTIQKWGLWGSKLYRYVFLMILLFKPDTFENSVCQDKTDQNESSNQGLHILPLCSRFTLLAAMDVSKHRD